MKDKITRIFLTTLLAISASTAVLIPTITSVYAATDPAPTTTEPPKSYADPHSGHH